MIQRERDGDDSANQNQQVGPFILQIPNVGDVCVWFFKDVQMKRQ